MMGVDERFLHLQRPHAPTSSSSLSGATRLFHRTIPGYEVTPVVHLTDVAESVGVADVMVKDESSRFGLPSFKILGGSWAVHRLLSRLADEPVLGRGYEDLRALAADLAPLTLVTATDGNHGRGVARMASLLALDSVVVVPNDMVSARIDAIRSEGAKVIVHDGDYDQAVCHAAALAAEREQWHVVADVATSADDEVPRWVIEGYETIFEEISWEVQSPPTAVFVQAGVGALAAAATGYYEVADPAVRIAVVEPVTAACLLESARRSELTSLASSQGSMMAGLNCGTPSSVAWPRVRARTTAFLAVEDQLSGEAMRLMADAGIVSGESGAAGLAGLLALADHQPARHALGLGPDARVLLLNTEGATDPDNYRRLVGRGPNEVVAMSGLTSDPAPSESRLMTE